MGNRKQLPVEWRAHAVVCSQVLPLLLCFVLFRIADSSQDRNASDLRPWACSFAPEVKPYSLIQYSAAFSVVLLYPFLLLLSASCTALLALHGRWLVGDGS